MAWAVLIYGVLILVGGIVGHWMQGSLASLISGIISGVSLIGSATLLFFHKKWGGYLALLFVFILDIFFTYRYLKFQKFMPAGLLSLISLVLLLYLARKLGKKQDPHLR